MSMRGRMASRTKEDIIEQTEIWIDEINHQKDGSVVLVEGKKDTRSTS
jgi:leucyl aminopeptidase (aminopeptidase T)